MGVVIRPHSFFCIFATEIWVFHNEEIFSLEFLFFFSGGGTLRNASSFFLYVCGTKHKYGQKARAKRSNPSPSFFLFHTGTKKRKTANVSQRWAVSIFKFKILII